MQGNQPKKHVYNISKNKLTIRLKKGDNIATNNDRYVRGGSDAEILPLVWSRRTQSGYI